MANEKKFPDWVNKKNAKRALVGLLIMVAASIMFTGFLATYYYSRYSSLIENELVYGRKGTSAILSRPVNLRKGQPISSAELESLFSRLGYAVTKESGRLTVTRRAGSTPIHLTLGGKEGQTRIESLSLGDREEEKIYLQPQFLSNLYGRSLALKRYVRYQEIPDLLIDAVLAAEDERFFEHFGVDFIATFRAAYKNYEHGRVVQGGSTLTQQFVKNYFLSPERTYQRKAEEALIALVLERRFDKKQIFELYANEIYLGQLGPFPIVGFGAAADVFFGKDISQLSLAEAALLAGMIKAPNSFSPVYDKAEAVERRDYVLALMRENRMIDVSQEEIANGMSVRSASFDAQSYYHVPYFVDYVRSVVEKESLDPEAGVSVQIHSTLDPLLQKTAFGAAQRGLKEIEEKLSERDQIPTPQVAMVVMDPRTGAVKALLGGRNYVKSQFNRAIEAKRQPGSTFKPFVYAAALAQDPESRLTLSSFLRDEPSTFKFGDEEYSPENYSKKYRGSVRLRSALALSLNVPTVNLAEEIGYVNVSSFSKKLGLNESIKSYPSLALGTSEVNLLELAQAYTAFANGGRMVPAHAIDRLEVNSQPVKVPTHKPMQVLDPEVAFLITSTLQSAVDSGTGYGVRRMGFRLPAAGKTGSSSDSWFVGYTPDLLCAVWVGVDSKVPLNLTGSEAALPIWTHFMKGAQDLGYLSGAKFEAPKNVVSVKIDAETGQLAGPLCEKVRYEFYIKGTQPQQECLFEKENFWFSSDAPWKTLNTSSSLREKDGQTGNVSF